MTPKLVDERKAGAAHYQIRPEKIDTSRPFFDVFNDKNAAIVAMWLVRYAKHLGGWQSFTRNHFQEFYTTNGGTIWVRFNSLYPEDFLVLGRDDCFRVTEKFIQRCHVSDPKSAPFRVTSPGYGDELSCYGLPTELTNLVFELIVTTTIRSQPPDATTELIALAKEYLENGVLIESESGNRLYEVMIYVPEDAETHRSFFTLTRKWPEGKLKKLGEM